MTDRIDTTKERKFLAALEGHTPGPWRGHNMVHEEGRQMTPEELGEYVCNSVKMGDLSRFLFVSGKHDDGGDCDVCHTGNGPRGPANTALIAAAPDLKTKYATALDALDAKDAEIVRLREALAPFAGAAESAIGAVGKTTTLGVLGAIAVYFVSWRDFTRARAALNPESEA